MADSPATAPDPQRIVFLGDSITDGHTYPSLVAQALADAGKPVPICTNAGIGGDTAAGMLKRLDRDVFVYKPDIMTLSAGINDVLHSVKTEDYARDAEAIVDAATKRHIKVIVLTTSALTGKHSDDGADARLAPYNEALHQIAEKYHCPVGEVNANFNAALKDGRKIMEVDDVHPNFEGQRLIARAVLDAMGDKDLAVPDKLVLPVMPGVITPWKIRPIDTKTDKPLDDATVAAVVPDATWKNYILPEEKPIDNLWHEQERQRGFAMSVDKIVGPAHGYLGYTTIDSDKEKTVYFNTGAQLQTFWVNGKKYYQQKDWCGWHAGRQRIPVVLKQGENIVVIETGSQFFLSVTDTNMW